MIKILEVEEAYIKENYSLLVDVQNIIKRSIIAYSTSFNKKQAFQDLYSDLISQLKNLYKVNEVLVIPDILIQFFICEKALLFTVFIDVEGCKISIKINQVKYEPEE